MPDPGTGGAAEPVEIAGASQAIRTRAVELRGFVPGEPEKILDEEVGAEGIEPPTAGV